MNLCEVSKDPKLYNIVLTLTKIFYSLNYQVNSILINEQNCLIIIIILLS